jgi:hypothetical protein
LLFLLCFFLSFATLLFCAFSLCCFTFFFGCPVFLEL